MIKSEVLKTVYFIEDTKTGATVGLEVTPHKIILTNQYAESAFVFENRNSEKTRAKWRNIAKMIEKAMDMVERDAKQVKKFV